MTDLTGEYQATCDGLRGPLKDHAATLANSPHGPSVITGAVVVETYQAACPH